MQPNVGPRRRWLPLSTVNHFVARVHERCPDLAGANGGRMIFLGEVKSHGRYLPQLHELRFTDGALAASAHLSTIPLVILDSVSAGRPNPRRFLQAKFERRLRFEPEQHFSGMPHGRIGPMGGRVTVEDGRDASRRTRRF